MKAATFNAPSSPLVVKTVDDPSPGPSELVIAVGACGICGTDLHWSENRDTSVGWRELAPGRVLGHEFAGEVVEVGRDVKNLFRTGDRVCALPFIGCGRCTACLAGRVYRCTQVDTRATATLPGAFAEFTRVGAAETVRLPAGVDDSLGALVEPLAVGLAAAERAQLKSGARVLIMGAGPVGLAVAMWCRFLGARHVVVSDVIGARAARSAEFGATDFIDANEDDVNAQMLQRTGGLPDVVFECVGLPGTLQLAIDYVANDGVVVVAGLCMAADSFLPAIAVVKAIDVRFTMCYEKRHFEVIVEHLDSGRINASHFVTATVGFDAFPEKFEQLKNAGSDLKVMLNPRL
ncbi:MAG: alcohol dehydrogenase catalytic domain-containing protein [Gammaproteobacteria bacterium]|nr:alcohol dehydrogenase catalytic domain-containing protein [Gammaproteobacteria bacterium]